MAKQGDSLKHIQIKFKDAVTSLNSKKDKKPSFIKSGAPISWQTRLDIYRYAYFERLYESLRDDFETVEKYVGKACFAQLVKSYVKKAPSHYASIGELSKAFPSFLKTVKGLKNRPFLSELALLEYRLIEAALFNEEPPSNLAQLSKIPESQFLNVAFDLHPSVQCFHTNFNVVEAYEEKNRATPTAKKSTYLVWQSAEKAYVRKLRAEEFLLYQWIHKKTPLVKLQGKLQKQGISENLTSTFLEQWSQCGILFSFHLKGASIEKQIIPYHPDLH